MSVEGRNTGIGPQEMYGSGAEKGVPPHLQAFYNSRVKLVNRILEHREHQRKGEQWVFNLHKDADSDLYDSKQHIDITPAMIDAWTITAIHAFSVLREESPLRHALPPHMEKLMADEGTKDLIKRLEEDSEASQLRQKAEEQKNIINSLNALWEKETDF